MTIVFGRGPTISRRNNAFRFRRRLHAPGFWIVMILLQVSAVRYFAVEWGDERATRKIPSPDADSFTDAGSNDSFPRSASRSAIDDGVLNSSPSVDPPRLAFVKRVVDGDTLLLDTGERVRLQGVDTPETKHPDLPVDPLGLKAAAYVAERVEGRTVELQFDREKQDQYGRTLAFVYIDGDCLNEDLIREGYSKAITRYPYSSLRKAAFINAEEDAKAAGRGLWAGKKRTR